VNSWTVIPVLATLTAWTVGFLVLQWAPGQPVSKRLAALFFAEGLAVITIEVAPPLLLTTSEGTATLISLGHAASDLLVLVFYLPFISVALGVPLVRPFQSRAAHVALAALGLGGLAAIAVFPSAFVAETIPVPGDQPVDWLFAWGPMWQVMAFGLVSMYTFGIVASLSALRSAQTDVARRRARMFLWAFGLRDLAWGGIYLFAIVAGNSITPTGLVSLSQVYSGSLLVYSLLVGYGILTVQLLDIDLKVRWTIKQGTVAAAFLAVFFLVSEGSELFLSNALGNVVGLLASALLIFVFAPLQHAADRLAERAMPGVRDTPEYASFRKLQVYAAALESAYQEGGVSERERSMLTSVATTLGIHPEDAEQLERDIREKSL
jgi:hypothetical protein